MKTQQFDFDDYEFQQDVASSGNACPRKWAKSMQDDLKLDPAAVEEDRALSRYRMHKQFEAEKERRKREKAKDILQAS